METVGTRLRKAREKKKLTLDDAQKALKVHPSILKALEENDAHKFLSPVYIRSFLRSYARYLGLNAERIAKEFSESHRDEPEQVLYLGPKKEMLDYIRRYLPLAAKVAGIILVLIIVAVIITRTVRFTKVFIAKRIDKVRVAEKTKPAVAVKKPAIDIPQNQPLTLIIKTKDDVWMEIKSDGKVVFRNVLSKGSIETWKAKKEIELWVGKADSLELILNGIPLGSPGGGVKRGILLTHEGMKLP